MKSFNNYEKTQVFSDFEKITAGGYSAVIKKAQVKEYTNRDGEKYERFEIAFDITEGRFKDYYDTEFKFNTSEDKKWKGVVRLYMPKDDGSEKDERTMAAFKSAILAIEDSNPGYHWDWDEAKLKGKKIGVLLRDEEWEYNGKTGWTARPFKFIDIAKIKDGKFKMPKEKPLQNGSSASQSASNSFDMVDIEEIDDEDIPF